ncbi:hypothetical protein C8R43DRAFT_1005373 [Mycena crocata]|nr:hypothetical protein C8R43DRAFT_1005373 [Mycena crocata]
MTALPSEIWLNIHRLATADAAPLTLAYADRFRYVAVSDPLMDMQHFLKDACSFALVSRLWNSLANDILFENIRVDGRFEILRAALERPGIAPLVRSIRLSPTRMDHNAVILALCPQVQVVVQPDAPSRSDLLGAVADADLEVQMQLPSLRHVYWRESFLSGGLLRNLLLVAPNLEFLYLSDSSILQVDRTDTAPDFPPIPSLQRLVHYLGSSLDTGTKSIVSILKADRRRLTRLHCNPKLLDLLSFPELPALRTLELFGSRGIIPFAEIFASCPRLQELCYDVWTGMSPWPTSTQVESPLSLVRMNSAVTIVRDWRSIEDHFDRLLAPGFPRIKRLVLHGTWHRVVPDERFARFRAGLHEQGCQIEFPEGRVL